MTKRLDLDFLQRHHNWFQNWGIIAGLVIQIIITIILGWQIYVLYKQIAIEQNESHEVRRAQLIATLYNLKDNCTEHEISKCEPLSSVRARVEAAKSLVTLDKSRNVDGKVDLSQLNLSNAIITNADFKDEISAILQ